MCHCCIEEPEVYLSGVQADVFAVVDGGGWRVFEDQVGHVGRKVIRGRGQNLLWH